MVRQSTTISLTVCKSLLDVIERDRKGVPLSAHLRKIITEHYRKGNTK